ncbi:MAG: hypothetical protein EA364_01905 [Balneolaceae bacterium]|nr:MAG: hypothetical protein EA364_01905 [Balneolaceae bacterium]
MRKFFPAVVICMLCMIPVANAQNEYENSSVYSSIGMGNPLDFRSSAGAAMGMSGVGIWSFNTINNSNPAHWGGGFFTMATASLSMKNFSASDNFGDQKNTMINFNQIQVVFPVWRELIGVSISIEPLTESRFSFFEQGTIPAADSLGYLIDRRGDGGLNKLEIGIGARITDWLLVGYAPSLVFGYYENRNVTLFDRSGFTDVNYTVGTRHKGFGNRFGILASHRGLLRSNDRVVLGSTVNLPVRLDSRRKMTTQVITGFPPRRKTIELFSEDYYGKGKTVLPVEMNTGLTYYANPYLLFASEILYQNWGEHKNFEGNTEDFLKDRTKYSFGIQYDARRRGESGFINNFVYRIGVSYDDGHLSLNNTSIETIMISAGISIPSAFFGSSIDLGVDYGVRGTRSNDLVQEKIFGLRASFNLSELMFLQRRLQ